MSNRDEIDRLVNEHIDAKLRIAELEEENKRLWTEIKAERRHADRSDDRAEAAEAALERVRRLNIPNLLRSLVHDTMEGSKEIRRIADELAAILAKTNEPPSRPIQGGWLEKNTLTGEVTEPPLQRHE